MLSRLVMQILGEKYDQVKPHIRGGEQHVRALRFYITIKASYYYDQGLFKWLSTWKI